MPSDHDWMLRAVDLAARGPLGDPNPRVGCVVVRDDVLLAEGWHRGAGTLHAEAAALADADAHGVDVTGATAYVTLEPCAHHGRTPPCCDALIRAGIARAVVADVDPHTRAHGGIDALRAAGIDVETGIAAGPAAELNRVWLTAVARQRPFVTWKYAATIDGFSAAADGTSQWISGPEARAWVHERRAEVGAILAGTGTVLADDPHLTARPGGVLAARQPLRVVMGLRDVPSGARVLDDAAGTLHLRTRSPREALALLHQREIRHVWLEGGPTMAAAFLREGLVDEVIAVIAPRMLGAGRSAVGDLGIATIADALDFDGARVQQVGADLIWTLTPQRRGADLPQGE